MWIIFFENRPCFWLTGGEIYRAGRKDCHVVIEDDPSISRTHLTFDVGLTPLQTIGEAQSSSCQAAAITLVDSSTYGSVVGPGVSVVRRPRGGTGSAETGGAGCVHSPQGTMSPRETGIVGLRYSAGLRLSVREGGSSSRKRGRAEPTASTAEDVRVTGEHHELTKGSPFRVPVDRPEWHEFSVVLGNRQATLTFLWVDVRVRVEGVDADMHTKLSHQLCRCGMRLVSESDGEGGGEDGGGESTCDSLTDDSVDGGEAGEDADMLVTDSLGPTPAVFAALLRACPIVRPAFFEAVLHRTTPQSPLPDPQLYLPLVDPVLWGAVLPSSGEGARLVGLDRLLAPRPQRLGLLSGLCFVVFQRELYETVSCVVRAGRGRVMWDGDSLAGVVNTRTREAILDAFATRHRGRVVLYSDGEPMPFRDCLVALQSACQLRCLEYRAVVHAVLHATPPHLVSCLTTDPQGGVEGVVEGAGPSARPSLAARPTTEARRTDADPLFPSLNVPAGEGRGGDGGLAGGLGTVKGRYVDEDGWATWDGAAYVEEAKSRAGREAGASGDGCEGDASGRPLRSRRTGRTTSHRVAPSAVADGAEEAAATLPPYPCFENTLFNLQGRQPGNSKRFHKQRSIPGRACAGDDGEAAGAGAGAAPLVELDWEFYAKESAVHHLTSRVPRIDADTILPDRADVVGANPRARLSGGGSGFPAHAANSSLSQAMALTATVFNAFDTAAHHAAQRTRAAKASRKGGAVTKALPTTLPTPGSASDPATGCHGSVGSAVPTAGPQAPTGLEVGMGDFSIFDIEGIF